MEREALCVLDAAHLATLSEWDQKQAIGERLYPLIQSRHGERAGKITGMLLEMDNSELLHMLKVSVNILSTKFNWPIEAAVRSHTQNPEALVAKEMEALHTLNDYLKKT